MHDAHWVQRVALEETSEHVPSHRPLAVAAVKPLTPATSDFTVETGQSGPIPSDTVVRAVTAYLLIQFLLLEPDWLMPMESAPCRNAPHCTAESFGSCLAFDNPLAFARSTPVMGETEKVKCPGTLGGLLATSGRRGRPAELNQPRLVGVDCQTVFAEPFRQHFQHALGVVSVTKTHHEIIRKADEEGPVAQTRLHVVLEPEIQQ
jgi:hypothetical protein